MNEDMLKDEISYVLNDYVKDLSGDDIETVYDILKDVEIGTDENISDVIRKTYDVMDF